jgi:hypothetical protein
MDITVIPKEPKYKVLLEKFPPVLSNKNLPEWYKNMKVGDKLHNEMNFFEPTEGAFTAKKCPAIQDLVSTGIIIPLWGDLFFKTERDSKGDIEKQNWYFSAADAFEERLEKHLNSHNKVQTEGMPIKKAIHDRVLKLTCPYNFIVPEGYNILYTDPFYHFRQDIRCLSGLVEADKWGFVSFPFEVLKENFVTDAGTPLVQLHIYKRESEKINLILRDGTEEEYNSIENKIFDLRLTGKHYRK